MILNRVPRMVHEYFVEQLHFGQVAFHANTGTLWTVGTSDNGRDMRLGMMPGTSPSLAVRSI